MMKDEIKFYLSYKIPPKTVAISFHRLETNRKRCKKITKFNFLAHFT